ncbi:MAG TPA: hypothetical protein VF105_08675, partial [Gemmatimonadaceae bacterium]
FVLSQVCHYPEAFDHVPQILWERAIISEIGNAGAMDRHGRDLVAVRGTQRRKAYAGLAPVSTGICKKCKKSSTAAQIWALSQQFAFLAVLQLHGSKLSRTGEGYG